jgi:hypothetical protein
LTAAHTGRTCTAIHSARAGLAHPRTCSRSTLCATGS